MSECNCRIKPDEDREDTDCEAESEHGLVCTKPTAHEGPHAACAVSEHPAEVWER